MHTSKLISFTLFSPGLYLYHFLFYLGLKNLHQVSSLLMCRCGLRNRSTMNLDKLTGAHSHLDWKTRFINLLNADIKYVQITYFSSEYTPPGKINKILETSGQSWNNKIHFSTLMNVGHEISKDREKKRILVFENI